MSTNPTSTDISNCVYFFNQYSNVFTAIASIATVITIIISLFAIYTVSKDSNNQILRSKYEEILQLIVVLSVEYRLLYDPYMLIEKSQSSSVPRETQNHLESTRQEIEKIRLEELYQKSIRLNVLANAYLKGHLKFDIVAYAQMFEALLNVLRTGDLKTKEEDFIEILPDTDKVFILTNQLIILLIKEINLGSIEEGYVNYRETVFKAKLGMEKKKNT